MGLVCGQEKPLMTPPLESSCKFQIIEKKRELKNGFILTDWLISHLSSTWSPEGGVLLLRFVKIGDEFDDRGGVRDLIPKSFRTLN